MAIVLTEEDWHILTLPFDYPYYYKIRKGLEEGAECAFCELDPDINPTIYENEHWIVTKNAFPNRRACAVMLLFISKDHCRTLGEISPAAWQTFADIIQWAESNFDLPGGALLLRFGDMQLNGGTIRHLHWNVMVPDKSGEVFAPIYKSSEAKAADLARTAAFAKRYETGEVPEGM